VEPFPQRLSESRAQLLCFCLINLLVFCWNFRDVVFHCFLDFQLKGFLQAKSKNNLNQNMKTVLVLTALVVVCLAQPPAPVWPTQVSFSDQSRSLLQ
jgi:hypothetical protein